MIPGIKKRTLNLYDLMMYVAIGRKHIRLMFLVMALSLTAGLALYLFSRPVFMARSLVRQEVIIRPSDADTVYRGTSGEVTVGQLTSPPMMERTAARFGIHENSRTIARKYVKRVDVLQNSDRNLEVAVWAFSYDLASKWAEVMIEEFLAFREEQRLNFRDTLIKSYTREMDQIGTKIDENITHKFDFDKEQGTQQSLIKANQLSKIPSDIVAAKQQVDAIERVRASLEDPNQDYVEKLSILSSFADQNVLLLGQVVPPSGISDTATHSETSAGGASNASIVVVPSLVKAGEQWQNLEKERRRILESMAQASQIYLPGHQKMIAFKKQLAAVDQELKAEYESVRARFDADYRALLRKVVDLEAKLPEYQDANKRLRQLQQKSVLHDNGQLAWNNMYSGMLKQLSAADFVQDKERLSLYYCGLLEAKSNPVSPNRLRMTLISIMVGIVGAIGLPFAIEYLDHTISDFAETESLFQIRGLGIIPILATKDVERAGLSNGREQEQALLENFRVIRTNILSIGALTKEPHVMMVTSSLPKEGKTVVSSNLALSFAHMGAKTLLVDADLRRGRIHRIFGLRKAPGLSLVLTGSVSLEEACRFSGRENLDVLTAGEYLSTGTELLSSPKFAETLAELRTRYDRIIVDTPPVLGLSETSVIQRTMDGVVFVAWSGQTPIKTMQVAVEMLQHNGANFYGFILNRLDLSNATNYYQYYYYSNDYYRNYHALENA
ncbi:MAG: polysaccharide biosynthesis tyrosine autokinase [Verrucomicrobiota bacterium]